MDTPPGAEQEQPPKWDPLGAAPFAWDLPEPGPTVVEPDPVPPAPRRRRGRVTLATLGIGIIAGALMFAVHPSWLTRTDMIGILLAITGFGMVFGAFRGGARGLVPFAIILAIGGFLSSQHYVGSYFVEPHTIGGHIGNVRYVPGSMQQIQTLYPTERSGNVEIDLTHLPTTTAVVRTGITNHSGSITVDVPKDAVVRGNCFAEGPNSQCIGMPDGSEGPPATEPADNPDGLTFVLSLQTDDGNVVINRV
jgi:hypothetical protein